MTDKNDMNQYPEKKLNIWVVWQLQSSDSERGFTTENSAKFFTWFGLCLTSEVWRQQDSRTTELHDYINANAFKVEICFEGMCLYKASDHYKVYFSVVCLLLFEKSSQINLLVEGWSWQVDQSCPSLETQFNDCFWSQTIMVTTETDLGLDNDI